MIEKEKPNTYRHRTLKAAPMLLALAPRNTSLRTKGKVASWNDEKGYGFISPMEGGERVFAHIKSFTNKGRRPAVGNVVTYSMSTDGRDRLCAKRATIAGLTGSVKRTV